MVAGGWWLGTRGECLSSTSHQPPFSEEVSGDCSFSLLFIAADLRVGFDG
jgi:hypothetical protein